MEKYRSLNEYMAAKHLQRNDVIESVAEAALTLLLFVDEHTQFEVSDIMKHYGQSPTWDRHKPDKAGGIQKHLRARPVAHR